MRARLIQQVGSQYTVATDTDEVVAAVALPAGGKLESVSLRISCQMPDLDVAHAAMYGVTMFAVPVLDPDGTLKFNQIWDAQVPKDKDEGAGVYDLDTQAADATPEFEMGEMDFETLIGAGGGTRKMWRRRRLIPFAESPVAFQAGTPDTFSAIDSFSVGMKQKLRVDVPTVVLLGFSSPVMDDTVSSDLPPPTEKQWTKLRFVVDTLKQAVIELLGEVEAGAETPWTEAAVFISTLLEGPFFEEDAGSFTTGTWLVYATGQFTISVPGEIGFGTLSSE